MFSRFQNGVFIFLIAYTYIFFYFSNDRYVCMRIIFRPNAILQRRNTSARCMSRPGYHLQQLPVMKLFVCNLAAVAPGGLMKLICKCTNLRASLIALGRSKPIITLFLQRRRRRDDGWKLFWHPKRLICLPILVRSICVSAVTKLFFYFLPRDERKTVV